MKYLLDTCVISELVKPVPYIKVVDWLNETPSDALFLSVITIGEIRKGLMKLPDSKKKERLTGWLNTLLDEYTPWLHKKLTLQVIKGLRSLWI